MTKQLLMTSPPKSQNRTPPATQSLLSLLTTAPVLLAFPSSFMTYTRAHT